MDVFIFLDGEHIKVRCHHVVCLYFKITFFIGVICEHASGSFTNGEPVVLKTSLKCYGAYTGPFTATRLKLYFFFPFFLVVTLRDREGKGTASNTAEKTGLKHLLDGRQAQRAPVHSLNLVFSKPGLGPLCGPRSCRRFPGEVRFEAAGLQTACSGSS